MRNVRANQIGLVAHYSRQGNWAFDLAFELARRKNLQLNIFCFSEMTYDKPFDMKSDRMPDKVEAREILIAEEKKLREYYDEYLEDYTDVGFKLCTRKRHNFELKSCMIKNEFQILIIPYVDNDMGMDDMPVLKFAGDFGAPIILVGPDREIQYHINYPASLLVNLGALPERFKDPGLVKIIPHSHHHIRF
ncbi:hypothetical protein ACFL6L_02530 [candidate division KSB1 bacterium]